VIVMLALAIGTANTAEAQQPSGDAPYLRDRGTGLPTSMFGTFIREGEWLIYPFFEYYRDRNYEYAPEEFGAVGSQDYRGRFRATEGLLFIGYGVSDRLAVEFEIATIKATLDKSPTDISTLPARRTESGLGDVEGQIRWRWRRETETRPEVFSYGEFVIPHAKNKALIGTPDWQFSFGTGIARGFPWGTLLARAAVEYDAASTSPFDLGEYGVEYLKRLSPSWRVYLGLEGSSDELAAIAEAQWHLTPNVFVRFNSGFGLSSKAVDFAPEVGIVFSIPTR
jgi:hypothetical protein